VGSPPGTLVLDPNAPKPIVHVIAYGPDKLEEREITNMEDLASFVGKWPVTWVNVDGLGDLGVLRRIGEIFGIHQLILENVVNVPQRAKGQAFEERLFIVSRMVTLNEKLETEQMSIFTGDNFVVSFQEKPGDCLDPVRDRIRKSLGRIRQLGPDHLLYALLDAVIDNYFPVLEKYGEILEGVEDQVVLKPDNETLSQIHEIRRELLILRRAAWPMREVANWLLRETIPIITPETRIYLRDCYDHAVQIIDLLENFREVGSGLMDAYLSSVSNRMNEVMKVLTVFAVIFIPLTFIAGLYGMNFNTAKSPWNMPELNWMFGYPFALGLMASTVIGMLIYFRRKGWLGS
jgi:magnesium transporter